LECAPNHIVPDFHGNLLTPTSQKSADWLGFSASTVASTTPDYKSGQTLDYVFQPLSSTKIVNVVQKLYKPMKVEVK